MGTESDDAEEQALRIRGRAVCLAFFVCMAFHALGFIRWCELRENIEMSISTVLALAILYRSPMLDGITRVIRVGMLIVISYAIAICAYGGLMALWGMACLIFGLC
jgi:hypothetical protein